MELIIEQLKLFLQGLNNPVTQEWCSAGMRKTLDKLDAMAAAAAEEEGEEE